MNKSILSQQIINGSSSIWQFFSLINTPETYTWVWVKIRVTRSIRGRKGKGGMIRNISKFSLVYTSIKLDEARLARFIKRLRKKICSELKCGVFCVKSVLISRYVLKCDKFRRLVGLGISMRWNNEPNPQTTPMAPISIQHLLELKFSTHWKRLREGIISIWMDEILSWEILGRYRVVYLI